MEKPDAFILHNSSDLIGEEITITSLGLSKKEETTIRSYKGIVFGISSAKHLDASQDQIEITGYSPEWLLHGRKRTRAFVNNSLSEIIQRVMKPFPKPLLAIDIKAKYKNKIPYVVQYQETDFEFISRLAKRYGEWFYNNGKTICFGELPKSKTSLTFGVDLNHFAYDMRLSAVTQESIAYNSSTGKIVKEAFKPDKIKEKTDIYHKKAIMAGSKKFGKKGHVEITHLPLEEKGFEQLVKDAAELKGNADVVNMVRIKAESINASIEGGQKVKIFGLDKKKNKFSYGEYIVEKITHFFDDSYNYKNIMLLQSAKTALPRFSDPSLIPLCHDLKKAKVTNIEDPEKLGRIKVKFSWMDKDGDTESPWIQMMRPYISEKGGIYFLPEIDTEVLVGFEGGNMERPYVYGSLYSKGSYKPDSSWSKENYFIRSKSGHTIHFADEQGKQSITIYDSEKNNKIIVSASDKRVVIRSEGDIEIKASGDLRLEAGNKVVLKGTSGVEIGSGADINLNANANIAGEAKASLKLSAVELKAEGQGTAEISSSGITTVKGSMVKIN